MTCWNIPAITLLAAVALSVAGCGDIAYKTGAAADQLRQDREACKASGDARQCLKDKGWTMTSVGEASPPAAPPTASAAPSSVPAASPPSSPSSSSSASPPVAVPPPEPAADPLRNVAIFGWAKFGGGSPDQAIAECVAALGPAHRPDVANHQVTAALLACMRGKNWQAL